MVKAIVSQKENLERRRLKQTSWTEKPILSLVNNVGLMIILRVVRGLLLIVNYLFIVTDF